MDARETRQNEDSDESHPFCKYWGTYCVSFPRDGERVSPPASTAAAESEGLSRALRSRNEAKLSLNRRFQGELAEDRRRTARVYLGNHCTYRSE